MVPSSGKVSYGQLGNEKEPRNVNTSIVRQLNDSPRDLLRHVRILLVVATPVEYDAVLRYLIPIPGLDDLVSVHGELLRSGDSNFYSVGVLNDYAIALVKSRPGSIGRDSATLVVYDALLTWKPKILIAVGIAFGNHNLVASIGDVVVADKVIPYEPCRIGDGKIRYEYRGEPLPCSLQLIKLLGNSTLPEPTNLKVLTGPILSGEKLVDSAVERQRLFKRFPGALAGDMESAGIASACHRQTPSVPWLVVKAVADWGEDKHAAEEEMDSVQPKAARSAAALLHQAFRFPQLNGYGVNAAGPQFPSGAPVNPKSAGRFSNAHNEIVIRPTPTGLVVLEEWSLQSKWPMQVSKRVPELFPWLEQACVMTGDAPRDDIDSLRRFQAWYTSYFRSNRKFSPEVTIPWDDLVLDGNLCTIGGPVDLLLTRYAMGYRFDGEGYEEACLPFMFPIHRWRELNMITRRWRGRSWPECAWYIEDSITKEPLATPEGDQSGVLNKDFIIISVVPNVATEEARKQEKKHLVAAAAHGLSQLALSSILSNDNLLDEISNRTESASYWEVVLKVPGIWRWDGYEACDGVSICKAVSLKPNDFIARPLYRDWKRSGESSIGQ